MRKRLWSTLLGVTAAAALAGLLATSALAQPEGKYPGGYQGGGKSGTIQRQGQQGQEKGAFDEPYLWGVFMSSSANAKNDWFYDSYSLDQYSKDWTDVAWYNQPEVFSGLFNDNLPDNDWFFDAYAPPAQDLFQG